MPQSLRTRPSNKTESIDYRVKLYSMAAAAAGVSVLALAQPAQGEVVVTKKNIPISGLGAVSIDLNNDGIADFSFSLDIRNGDHSFYRTLFVAPLTGGEAVGGGRGSHGPYASALVRGAKIGPSAHFSSSAARGELVIERSVGFASATTTEKFYGDWGGNPANRYLGVKFLIDGKTHYGWVRLTVLTNGDVTATITAYAYETIANKKLDAGVSSGDTGKSTEDHAQNVIQTSHAPSLGILALGANGLALWRRDETLHA
jgi:hypothetical protein